MSGNGNDSPLDAKSALELYTQQLQQGAAPSPNLIITNSSQLRNVNYTLRELSKSQESNLRSVLDSSEQLRSIQGAADKNNSNNNE
jgi:hypothetical protein